MSQIFTKLIDSMIRYLSAAWCLFTFNIYQATGVTVIISHLCLLCLQCSWRKTKHVAFVFFALNTITIRTVNREWFFVIKVSWLDTPVLRYIDINIMIGLSPHWDWDLLWPCQLWQIYLRWITSGYIKKSSLFWEFSRVSKKIFFVQRVKRKKTVFIPPVGYQYSLKD